MAVAVGSPMSYELLSRLPPNSFVAKWRTFYPDVPNENLFRLRQGDRRINFPIRGATNEFFLNGGSYLGGSAYTRARMGTDVTTIPTSSDLKNVLLDPPIHMSAPYHWFSRCRESMDAGALPLLDNTSAELSHEINNLRVLSIRRNRVHNGAGLNDCCSGLEAENQRQSWTTGGVASSSAESLIRQNSAWRILRNSAANTVQRLSYGNNRAFQIPLGMFSHLSSCPSPLPIGMFSSYSTNGWQIELFTAGQGLGDADRGPIWTDNDQRIATTTLTNYEAYMRNLHICAPVIQILDPMVMQSILQLYYKTEMEMVGGVQFPLSLRLNCLSWRSFGPFPLNQGQTDYYFNLPGTDRSVRAWAWSVYDRTRNAVGKWDLVQPVRVTRLRTNIGVEEVHDIVEDIDSNQDNVRNFVNVSGRHSAAMFSCLPYYQEGILSTGHQEDDNDSYNQGLDALNLGANGSELSRRFKCYGYVSLENMDRRTGVYSDSFEACGKDLTNVGRIEVQMRIMESAFANTSPPAAAADNDAAKAQLSKTEAGDAFQPLSDSNRAIHFLYVYDTVLETSPQGVVDLSKSAL